MHSASANPIMSDQKPSPQIRQAVFERAAHCCEYCRCPANHSSDYFNIEHITPRILGGTNDMENLALSCQGCNSHKFTKIEAIDPVEGIFAPLYHPRLHAWNEHFVWNEDFTLILGKTPTGRATIKALHLNREGVINLRSALRLLKRHPPTR